jgi:hypothetical protein
MQCVKVQVSPFNFIYSILYDDIYVLGLKLKKKFSFSYFRENFRFSQQNMTKSRENNGKFI